MAILASGVAGTCAWVIEDGTLKIGAGTLDYDSSTAIPS